MEPSISQYPRIRIAALEIAYDNGMVNRGTTEQDFLRKAEEAIFADGVPTNDVVTLELFLQTLTPEEVETICCGDREDAAKIESRAPLGAYGYPVTKLLEDIFQIC